MKNCKAWMIVVSIGALLCLGGCGTISFFPYVSATKAADKVLDGILPDNGGSENVPEDSAKVSEIRKP